jgi:hypothetical protein
MRRDWDAPRCREGGDVEGFAHLAPATPDAPCAPPRPALAGMWREAGQGDDPSSAERTEFGILANRVASTVGPMPGTGASSRARSARLRLFCTQGRDLAVELLDPLVQKGDHALDVTQALPLPRAVAPDLLGLAGLDQLPATAEEVGKPRPVRVGRAGVPPPDPETPGCVYAASESVSIWSRRNWAGERWPWRSISQRSL